MKESLSKERNKTEELGVDRDRTYRNLVLPQQHFLIILSGIFTAENHIRHRTKAIALPTI
ncbi:hypothetical protein T265_11042 [Opisthorchis viverrini]|uniref:Uncharacterized protein n=1 Tax=Opisthorchis viverrini TaxID=6198 RepID=A0A074ZYX4_OPIVI|nr:hypothetical protein T265_11042 [Opisthorchis viverrini]KER20394.1 hypothetical protein T265_11042 [Opisthorchis viverrini]